VAEETYIELKAKSERDLTLKQFVQMRVYEVVEKYEKEL